MSDIIREPWIACLIATAIVLAVHCAVASWLSWRDRQAFKREYEDITGRRLTESEFAEAIARVATQMAAP